MLRAYKALTFQSLKQVSVLFGPYIVNISNSIADIFELRVHMPLICIIKSGYRACIGHECLENWRE